MFTLTGHRFLFPVVAPRFHVSRTPRRFARRSIRLSVSLRRKRRAPRWIATEDPKGSDLITSPVVTNGSVTDETHQNVYSGEGGVELDEVVQRELRENGLPNN